MTQTAAAPATTGRTTAIRLTNMFFATAAAAVAMTAAADARGRIVERLPALEAALPRFAAPVQVVKPPVVRRMVWEGADVDGDGAADFHNPTGLAPRSHDAYGSGAFGASRDGGHRRHEGVDFVAEAGQAVAAPISGFVSKIGQAYADAPELRFVEISNPALGYVARVFYVEPSVELGDAVRLGSPIGKVRTLQDRYPGGMTDHVHFELAERGARIDATRMLVRREVVEDVHLAD